MPQSLHWSDWQDAGAPTEGAQEGLNIRQCVPIGGCKACNGCIPYNQVEGSRGGRNHHPCYRKRYALESWHIRTEQHKLKMNQNNGPLPPVYNPLVHLSHLQSPTDLVGHHPCYLCLFTLTQPSVFSNPIISVTSLILCYFIDRF